MAFTLRTDEKHDKILDGLCEKLDMKARSKVVLWLIENFEQCDQERLDLHNDLVKTSAELRRLKNAVRTKMKAEVALMEIVAPEPRGMVDPFNEL